jgi:hypothetical protein
MIPGVDGPVPQVVAVKQAEYRDILLPDRWALPDPLPESLEK